MKRSYLKILSILTLAVMIFATACGSNVDEESYNYISPEEFKARLDAGDFESGDMIMVDSQTEEEYADSHLEGVIATHARPLESDEDFAKLEPALDAINSTDADVILICPGGGSGATRPFDYFSENGVDEDRMLILEGGQGAFNDAFPDSVIFGE